MDDTRPRPVWQRLPVLPGVFGRMLIRSQSPDGKRKVRTTAIGQPAASAIGGDIVRRFAEQQRQAAPIVRALDEEKAARAIMTSPFIPVVSYSVLDGWRLVVAHGRRHVEQARRVTLAPGFPAS